MQSVIHTGLSRAGQIQFRLANVASACGYAVVLLLACALFNTATGAGLRGSLWRVSPADGTQYTDPDDAGINRTIANPPGYRKRHGGRVQVGEPLCFSGRLSQGAAGRRLRFGVIPPSVGSISVSGENGLDCGPSLFQSSGNTWGGFRYVECRTVGPAPIRNAMFCITPTASLANQSIRVLWDTIDSQSRKTVIDVAVRARPATTPGPARSAEAGSCIQFGEVGKTHRQFDGAIIQGPGSPLWKRGNRYYSFGGSPFPTARQWSLSSWTRNGNTWIKTLCDSEGRALSTTVYKLYPRENRKPNPAAWRYVGGSYAGLSGLRHYLEHDGDRSVPDLFLLK